MAFFQSTDLGEPDECYVVWFDLMGCKNLMNGPIKVAAQSVYKIHVAALEAKTERVDLYPVMDGFYATCSCPEIVKDFVRAVFRNLLWDLCNDSGKPGFQYLARAAVSFGEIYHGKNLPNSCSNALAQNPSHRDSIVLGLPVIDAFSTESDAPPFGVAVHKSCTQTFVTDSEGGWWKWFNTAERDKLVRELKLYFKGKRAFPEAGYPSSKINVHEALAMSYLAEE